MEPVVEEGHEEGHAEAHHEESFIRRWVFSQDHKVIGCQYAITALLFLFFGFCPRKTGAGARVPGSSTMVESYSASTRKSIVSLTSK